MFCYDTVVSMYIESQGLAVYATVLFREQWSCRFDYYTSEQPPAREMNNHGNYCIIGNSFLTLLVSLRDLKWCGLFALFAILSFITSSDCNLFKVCIIK